MIINNAPLPLTTNDLQKWYLVLIQPATGVWISSSIFQSVENMLIFLCAAPILICIKLHLGLPFKDCSSDCNLSLHCGLGIRSSGNINTLPNVVFCVDLKCFGCSTIVYGVLKLYMFWYQSKRTVEASFTTFFPSNVRQFVSAVRKNMQFRGANWFTSQVTSNNCVKDAAKLNLMMVSFRAP